MRELDGARTIRGQPSIEDNNSSEAFYASPARGSDQMTHSRTPGRSRLARRLSWLVVASLTSAALFAPGAASAAHPVVPVTSETDARLAGNPNCADSTGGNPAGLDDWYGTGQVWLEAKLDAAPSALATVVVPAGTVTITSWDPATKTFSWTSTFGIDAAFIKSGQGGDDGFNTLYVYAPAAEHAEATSGTNRSLAST